MTGDTDAAVNVALSDGLRGVGAILPIDERIPWLPRGQRGFEPNLIYVLEGKRRSLVIDTGLPIHRRIIVSQLRRVLPRDNAVSIVVTRPEPDSFGNVGALADEFAVERIVGFSTNPLEFFPESMLRAAGTVRFERRRLGESWEWDDGRIIEFLPAPFGLLVTAWPYDVSTETLFTTDSFGWIHLTDPESPCRVDAPLASVTPSTIEHHLSHRFHWLADCRLELVEEAMRRIFEERSIRMIAPAHGCVFSGEAYVRSQYRGVRDALTAMRHRGPVGVIPSTLDGSESSP